MLDVAYLQRPLFVYKHSISSDVALKFPRSDPGSFLQEAPAKSLPSKGRRTAAAPLTTVISPSNLGAPADPSPLFIPTTFQPTNSPLSTSSPAHHRSIGHFTIPTRQSLNTLFQSAFDFNSNVHVTMRGLRPAATTATALTRASILPQSTRRAFTGTTARKAGAHGPQYDPPTGWLWGVKPGEKPKKEGWEDLAYYGFLGSLAVFSIAYAFKPDTS